MMETPRNWIEESDRAVSPVIGVILMVAITVILAAVIGTFVLELGQGAGEKAPSMSASFADDEMPYDKGTVDDRMFRIKINGLSDTVTVADVELRVIEPDGTTHSFFGQNALDADSDMNVTINGQLNSTNSADGWDASTELGVGDTLIIGQESGDIADDTDYTIQFVFLGGESPKVMASAEVRLK